MASSTTPSFPDIASKSCDIRLAKPCPPSKRIFDKDSSDSSCSRSLSSRSCSSTDLTYFARARRVSWTVVKRQRRVVEYRVVRVRVIAMYHVSPARDMLREEGRTEHLDFIP